MAAWAAAEEIPKHDHPGRAEHSGGLGNASRQVRPVAERHRGEHQIEAGVGKGLALGSSLDVPHRQPARSRRNGACDHPPGQVNADQLGRWIARSCRAKQPASATANVQNPSCLGQEPPTKLQGCLLSRNEQEVLEDAVLVGARSEVEPTRGRTWVAHESALVAGGSVGGWRWLPVSRAPIARQSSRWPLSWSRTSVSWPAEEAQPHWQMMRQGRRAPDVRCSLH